MDFKKNTGGYLVVEAAFVFPVVLLCVIALLLISVYLYQKANIQSSAEIALTYYKNELTDTYVSAKPMDYSGESFSGSSLSEYGNKSLLSVFSAKKDGSLERFTQIFNSVYYHQSSSNGSVKVEKCDVSGAFFYKTIDVTISSEIKLPISLGLIGVNDDSIKYKIDIRTAVNDSDQFIRDFSVSKEFVLFLYDKIDKKTGIGSKISDMKDKFISFYEKYLKPGANPF